MFNAQNTTHVTNIAKVFVLVLFAAFSANSFASHKITFAFSNDPEISPQFKFFEMLYREAFTRLDYEFSYQVLPMKRCSVMVNSGKLDGEPQRYHDYANTYTNLIRVEEPVFVTNVYAFATNKNIKINTWDDFKGTSLYVDYVIGALQTEQALVTRVEDKYLTGLKSVTQGLERLHVGRSDVFVDLEIRTKPHLQTIQFTNSRIRIVGTLSSHNSYAYIHKRHSELAPKLAKVIKEIKAEGLYDKLIAKNLPFMLIAH
ncbi:substrate-binding periplasmic protein [Pseudoalteromonas sp. SSM20]|uniref:substrate-binding periplasmic protein n=1 Tax=Pseudoalteromonas sp. SSM20 TaxID=3139394 RepID=UPI003BAAB45F